MSLRILHAADFHLDSPYEGLSADKAALRRSEMRQLPRRIAELAVREGADMLLLAGDLLDSTAAYTETGEELQEALSRLDIPVFIAPGNHDFVSRRSIYMRSGWSENVHIFRRSALEKVPLPSLGVNVWGAGYTARSCPPLLRGFTVPEEDRGEVNILLLHAEVTASESPYAPVTEAELARSGFDYAALGHTHLVCPPKRAGQCTYAWPGCPEGRGFDECGEKGVLLAERSGAGFTARFISTGLRRHRSLSVPAGENALQAVLSALPEHCEKDIINIMLIGERRTKPDVPYLQSALEGSCFALTIQDATTPCRDIWAGMEENTLTGRFLQRMHRLLEIETDEEQRALILQAAEDGLAVLEGREVRL